MKINNHSIKNYRNIEQLEINPDSGINVIFGENGHGKTNIIESIWLCTGCHSFRTRKNSELIKKDCDKAEINMAFFSQEREQNFKILIGNKKEIYLNEIKKESPRKVLGEFKAIVFSPSMLSLIQDGPSEKRKFTDIAIGLLKPGYVDVLSKYSKVILQRNSLLKKIQENPSMEDLLFTYDEQAAYFGGKIIKYRTDYINKLKNISAEIYKNISADREKFKMSYISSVSEQGNSSIEWSQILYDYYINNHKKDIFRASTSSGPHKDDILIELSTMNARSYGSQGQQRTAALALKLGEATIMSEEFDEAPVALLDDVMSELDEKRQTFLLKYLEGWQTFITCCDKSQISKVDYGKIFNICDGRLK